jgi:hypothetical protein
MVIHDLAEKNGWDYETAMERFYNSNTCQILSDSRTGYFTFAPWEIVRLFEEEK